MNRGGTDEDYVKVSDLRKLIEALPVHEIGGYEWECDTEAASDDFWQECHNHYPKRVWDPTLTRYVNQEMPPCVQCGQPITVDESVDRDGHPEDHQRLVNLDRVLELLG